MNRRQYLQGTGVGVATTGTSGVSTARSPGLGADGDLNTTLTTTGGTSDYEKTAEIACGETTVTTGIIVASDDCVEPAVADVSLSDGTCRLEQTVDDSGNGGRLGRFAVDACAAVDRPTSH